MLVLGSQRCQEFMRCISILHHSTTWFKINTRPKVNIVDSRRRYSPHWRSECEKIEIKLTFVAWEILDCTLKSALVSWYVQRLVRSTDGWVRYNNQSEDGYRNDSIAVEIIWPPSYGNFYRGETSLFKCQRGKQMTRFQLNCKAFETE